MDIFKYPQQAKLFSTRHYLISQLQHNYYIHLNKEVVKKSKRIQLIQSILYKNHLHILHLPQWFYYPGILIFGCKHSDLLLKMVVWQILVKLESQPVHRQILNKSIYRTLVKHGDFFTLLPNVSRKKFYHYCTNQLVRYLVKCDHLLLLNHQTYYVRKLTSNMYTEVLYEAFKKINDQTFNSSVPIKNMIE